MARTVKTMLVTAVVLAGLAGPAQAQAGQLRTVAAGSVGGYLYHVSCTSTGNCWAVGALNTDGTLIEHWDGSTWQVAPSPNPPNATKITLDGVACAQVTSCWAVGYHGNATGRAYFPFAEHWNGRAWTETAMPSPPATRLNVTLMRAVSCPAATLCFADGSGNRESRGRVVSASLIERWNGRSWKIVPSPILPRSNITDLQGLSCASARDCWATGDWIGTKAVNPPAGAFGDHWNGQQWTAWRIGRAVSGGRDLFSVSCPVAGTCMAVGLQPAPGPGGFQALRPYAERWTGSSWVAAPIGTIASIYLSVREVACATSQLCEAVGGNNHSGGSLVEQWNGSSWAAVPSPNPPGATNSYLAGVTCPQGTNCWAVGDWNNSTVPGNALIEHWNGTTWTIVSS